MSCSSPRYRLLSLGSYFAINHFSGNYGWPALFYNSFLGGLTAPGETLIHISRSAYLHQVVRGAYLWLISGSFALYLLPGRLGDLAQSIVIVFRHDCRRFWPPGPVCYILYPNGDQRYTAVLFVADSCGFGASAFACRTLRDSTSISRAARAPGSTQSESSGAGHNYIPTLQSAATVSRAKSKLIRQSHKDRD